MKVTIDVLPGKDGRDVLYKDDMQTNIDLLKQVRCPANMMCVLQGTIDILKSIQKQLPANPMQDI